ncbi:MAG: hypothetical protein JO300_02455 [Silvibacterium sp.]|nr:hypothetical protein [Silvibacterium sp.]MBV8438139.1 hypothetical protein [Silvibacterium sp.]
MTDVDQIENERIREDANDVLNASVSYAKRMLRRYGEFGPFGFAMNHDGEVKMEPVAQRDMPADPAMLLDLLQQQMTERARKGKLRAAASASNVTMGKPSQEGYGDAIMIDIEHETGYCVKAFVPYRITGGQMFGFFPRIVRFGAIRTQEGEARLFAR